MCIGGHGRTDNALDKAHKVLLCERLLKELMLRSSQLMEFEDLRAGFTGYKEDLKTAVDSSQITGQFEPAPVRQRNIGDEKIDLTLMAPEHVHGCPITGREQDLVALAE